MADIPAAAATVLERCSIHPSADTEITKPLLYFDMLWLYAPPVQHLLFFDFPGCSEDHFLKTLVPKLKESLRQTLVHFLPYAGNVVHPLDSGTPFFRFSPGDSVPLTVAECTSDFNHLTGNHPRVADDFYACVPRLPPPKHSPNDDLFQVLALQITLFPDRGLCLGFTFHHAVGDASTFVRLIKAWASVNKFGGDGKLAADNLLPFYDRTTVADPEGLDKIYWNLIGRPRFVEIPAISFPINKLRQTFILTGDHIQKLKNAVLQKNPGKHITAFTVTCGLIWSCLIKVDTDAVADDEPEYFGFASDCRSRLSPPLPAEYFGNCLGFVMAESKHGLLKGKEGFLLGAECIGDAIQRTVYNEKGILDGADRWPLEFRELLGKRVAAVGGSPRIELYDADYGWGRPKKIEVPSIDGGKRLLLCMSRDYEGGVEISLSRPGKVLDSFAAVFTQELGNLHCFP